MWQSFYTVLLIIKKVFETKKGRRAFSSKDLSIVFSFATSCCGMRRRAVHPLWWQQAQITSLILKTNVEISNLKFWRVKSDELTLTKSSKKMKYWRRNGGFTLWPQVNTRLIDIFRVVFSNQFITWNTVKSLNSNGICPVAPKFESG